MNTRDGTSFYDDLLDAADPFLFSSNTYQVDSDIHEVNNTYQINSDHTHQINSHNTPQLNDDNTHQINRDNTYQNNSGPANLDRSCRKPRWTLWRCGEADVQGQYVWKLL
jgi:hypothetical protein